MVPDLSQKNATENALDKPPLSYLCETDIKHGWNTVHLGLNPFIYLSSAIPPPHHPIPKHWLITPGGNLSPGWKQLS